MANIRIDQLENEIAKAMAEYTEEVQEEIDKATDDVTKQAVSDLKQNSPKDTEDYSKGWTRTKQGDGYVIHNKTDYQLTHLLEHGHVKASGGRVPAKVHIRPVEEKAVQDFEKRVEKAIKR